MLNNPFFEACAFYDIMWKNTVGPGRSQMSIWHVTGWITKATDTHSEYVIRIAFLPQQSLHERASMSHYTNIASLV